MNYTEMNHSTTQKAPRFDTNALNRAFIGFDKLFDTIGTQYINQQNNNYPPHNIIKQDDNRYIIELAIAGFKKSDITISVEQQMLSIIGDKAKDEDREYIHRGISSRTFSKQFNLAEHIVVKDALIDNGILQIQLERIVPEEMKVRVIDVKEVK